MKNYLYICFLIFALSILSCGQSTDRLVLPKIFSDGMIMQRDTTVSIWGTSKPNNLITVSASWGFNSSTSSDSLGNWKTSIRTVEEEGPFSLVITSGKDRINIKDVLMGEVWLAAGQSNMEMNFDYCCNSTDSSEKELLSANNPKIRMFNVKKNLSHTPVSKVEGKWEPAVGENIIPFSAVGYFFAKELNEYLNVPIGIIHASWGGSSIEAWTSLDVFGKLEQYKDELSQYESVAQEDIKAREWFSQFRSQAVPSGAFDLFLGEFLGKKRPNIGYMDYFHADWSNLDHIGSNDIEGNIDESDWLELDSTGRVDNLIGIKNFTGASLFLNHFLVTNSTSQEYSIKVAPEKNMPWGLWEYDVFVNSKKIGSSLLEIKKEDYNFYKTPKEYAIEHSLIKTGENQVIIRVLGYSRMGEVSLLSSSGSGQDFIHPWRSKILAEEFFQIDNYQYPYTSLYFYEDNSINIETSPARTIINHQTIGTLFNGMLNPVIPYGIKGMIWYQGETNIEQGGPDYENYRTLMPLVIKDWRERWGFEFPFYFSEIAPYFNYNGMLPYFRNVQKGILNVPKTGMIVTLDIGENFDIHPSNKHDVGDRFSRIAINRLYGGNGMESGPAFESSAIDGDKISIYFDHTGSGLKIRNSDKNEFQIAAEDKKFFNAMVNNHSDHLEVFSNEVENPVYVRYAWSDTASATLFNLEGLPASSFSTEFENQNR